MRGRLDSQGCLTPGPEVVAGGDIARLAPQDDTDQAFYRGRVVELETEFRLARRCHPESGYFRCFFS